MTWTEIDFGKHKGKTLPQVVFADPDWFFWAWDKGVFRERAAWASQAKEIYRKATHIKVPLENGQRRLAEYWIHPDTNKFCELKLVPETRPPHQGASKTERLPYIDMSFPRQISAYDKTGCNLLVKALKHYLFGDRRCRLTKELCEDFFDDDSNFEL